jgi:hypothetical protein
MVYISNRLAAKKREPRHPPKLWTLDPFYDPRVPAFSRIGPHRIEIYSIFYGTLLGDGYGERHGDGARIHFHQSHIHRSYLNWLHQRVRQYGYVNPNLPKTLKQIGDNGTVYYSLKLRTWTFRSLIPLVDSWYAPPSYPGGNRKKILPHDREEYYTPLSLALTILDDGHYTGYGIQIGTDCFTEEEVNFLANMLYRKFNLTASIHIKKKGWRLYIQKASMTTVRELIKEYICESMLYKRDLMNFKKSN